MQHTLFTTIQKSVLFLGLFLFVSLFSVQKSYGEAAIIVGDDVKIKFGVLFQGQIDESQSLATNAPAAANDNYQQNIFLRRARLLIGGQIAPNVTFFYESDNPNLGKTTAASALNATNTGGKNLPSSGLNTLDAVLTWKVVDPLNIDMGLILVPKCRNCLQGAAQLLSLDYGPNSFNESAQIGADIGRDTGVQLRSYLLSDRLEIRAGLFQGLRNGAVAQGLSGAYSPFRYAGRLQYNFFETEKGLFYTGTYLGKKKVLAVGASVDGQGDYQATAFDTFLDLPLGGNLAVTAQVDYNRFMPGPALAQNINAATGTSTSFVDQADWMFEAGVLQTEWKLMPFVQFADEQRVSSGGSNGSDVRKMTAGIAYYFSGYNANLKFAGTHVGDDLFGASKQFTVQLQGFYF